MIQRKKIMNLFFVVLALCTSSSQSASVADEIPGNDIPKIEYHIDTGLVLLDPDGLALTDARLAFSLGTINTFFDNSPDNPLFAEHDGLIPNWISFDVGEAIFGESTVAEGYSGPMRAWAQISSGFGTDDFWPVRYYAFGGSPDGIDTNVTVVPEPGTLLLLGLGGLALLRNRKGKKIIN